MSDLPKLNDTPVERHRGIYLLPNLFTTAALFAGFFSIINAINGHFETASIALFVAMVLDGLDGRVARFTHTESDFGAEYDSLSDMVAFGLAPALVMYLWALKGLGKIGWLAAFVFAAGAALRLARFNTQIGIADKRYFQGLPSPSAAAILAAAVWLGIDRGVRGDDVAVLASLVCGGAGLLMVSNFRYHSFKQIDLRGRIPFIFVVAIMLAFAAVFLQPPLVLFTLFFGYALSGPALTLWLLRQRRRHRVLEERGNHRPLS